MNLIQTIVRITKTFGQFSIKSDYKSQQEIFATLRILYYYFGAIWGSIIKKVFYNYRII
jgi:hypothetical protein